MNRLPLTFQPGSPLPRVALFVAAAVVALFLMTFYVRLLHVSVERGAQLRYSQQTAQDSAFMQTSMRQPAAPVRERLTVAAAR